MKASRWFVTEMFSFLIPAWNDSNMDVMGDLEMEAQWETWKK
jgi:hypothetical protein